MNIQPVKTAIVGCGGISDIFFKNFTERFAIIDLVKCCSRGKASADKKAQQYGIESSTLDEILADPEIELIANLTPPGEHYATIKAALEAGKHVICEKPMAETEEETQAVLAAERRARGRLAIGFNRRFAPAYLRVRELMRGRPRPWFLHYRLMYPSPSKQRAGDFYEHQPRILYEGCHILDFVSFLLEATPRRVFMTGDRYINHACILDYPDGSQVTIQCGSLGSYCLWKEYLELFAENTAITVSDFTDLRVRGIPGAFDELFPPHRQEHAAEVRQYGFDFYEQYKGQEMLQYRDFYKDTYGMDLEAVRRPQETAPPQIPYRPEHPDLWSFVPDKGWIASFEHFAEACRTGTAPLNADGAAGKLATDLALALLQSLDAGLPVPFQP